MEKNKVFGSSCTLENPAWDYLSLSSSITICKSSRLVSFLVTEIPKNQQINCILLHNYTQQHSFNTEKLLSTDWKKIITLIRFALV